MILKTVRKTVFFSFRCQRFFVLFCFVLFCFVLFCSVLFCFCFCLFACLFVCLFVFVLFVCLFLFCFVFCFVFLFCFVLFCFVFFCFWFGFLLVIYHMFSVCIVNGCPKWINEGSVAHGSEGPIIDQYFLIIDTLPQLSCKANRDISRPNNTNIISIHRIEKKNWS